MVSETQRRELLGLALLALALLILLSLVPLGPFGQIGVRVFPSGNIMGVVGRLVSAVAYGVFGLAAPIGPAFFALGGAACFGWMDRGRAVRWAGLLAGVMVLLPTAASLLAGVHDAGGPAVLPPAVAGWMGRLLGLPLFALLGGFGATLALLFLALALPVATIGWNPARSLALGVQAGLASRRARASSDRADGATLAPAPNGGMELHPWELTEEEAEAGAEAGVEAMPRRESISPPKPVPGPGVADGRRKEPVPVGVPSVDLTDSGDPASEDLPPLSLLTEQPAQDTALGERELERLGQVLIATLKTFKVEGKIAGRTTGPVVTQFEVVPAPGVKVNRIAALDADLALALRAPSIRIVAPIPGKGAVGVEVPNPTPDVVYLREILESPAFRQSRGLLPLALGKDLAGKAYVADLARTPHLLIAGATGSGKSVCINTIITSLVYRHSPRTLRLLMIDPKMVELSMYSDLPHLRHPVVTDPNDAAVVLKWARLEMERRYALLSVNGTRSLAEFNQRVAAGQVVRRPNPVGEDGDPERWIYNDGPLPLIVVVVDELADLMMAVQAEIERPLAQLAQKARAIGIHLIVATQRPSVNVITGLIKANFPSRIGFRVSSKVDSRTILDQNGADALLGNGDMLFLPPGTSDPVRIQGAYLATEDTERLMSWYRAKARERIDLEDDILDLVRAHEAETAGAEEGGAASEEERDALFRAAAEVCVQARQGSTSLLQRKLRVGYGRAARIIDQLHTAGILGPPDGSKPREVLVGMESVDHICGDG